MTIDLQEDLSIVGTNMVTDMSATMVTQVPTYSLITDATRIDATETLDLAANDLTSAAVASLKINSDTMNIGAASAMALNTTTLGISAQGTAIIDAATMNFGSSGTTTIKSSFLDLNPGGTMSPSDAPEVPDTPLVPAPTSPNALPAVGFDALESAPFEVQIDEADTDISFPTPKYSVITPDGTASYSQQILNLQNTGTSGISGFSGQQLNTTMSADVEISQDGKIIYQDDAGTTVKYVNAHATRNKVIVSQLEQIIIQAAKNTGLSVEIFSGGMTPQRRTGSDRHLNGFAADVWLYTSEGKRLNVQSQQLRDWCQQAKNAGATAIGAGVGYMGAVGVHLDISAGNTVPAGSAKYWGAGGRSANAPQWLINIMTG